MQRTLATLFFLFALLLGGNYIASGSQSFNTGFAAAMAQTTGAEVDTSEIKEMMLGDENAPITIVEYASFTCPHCARFHHEVFPQIKKNYIDTGKVKFILRDVYFDRFGLWASMLARCGGEVRYFGIADLIFQDQKGWLAGGDPAKATANLRTIGKTAGLSDDQLDACFADQDKAKALVAWYQKHAEEDGLEGTPSFIINGQKYGNMSYADFAKVLDEKLAQ